MAKKKSSLFCCDSCGYETQKWLGRCPGCGEWNSLFEVTSTFLKGKSGRGAGPKQILAPPVNLAELKLPKEERYKSGISEFDRVLGGGAVPGSVVLIGGDPGIGKSTLLLKVAATLSLNKKVFYASGEESLQQLKMRAERLNIKEAFSTAVITNLEELTETVLNLKPDVLVADSVQALYSSEISGAPGSVSQVREVTGELVRLAKEQNITVFLIGHVTKEGAIAGPRLLEHMVDCVLYLEGDRYHNFRILRGVKNRFGPTSEIGVFTMEEEGLMEVDDPAQLFITRREVGVPGAVITASMEGTRPLLIEIQSLVAPSNYPTPRRTSSGLDSNRVALVMAVLEKHAGTSFFGLDTFVNVVGGVKLSEPAADLALALSLSSGLRGKAVAGSVAAAGELGLTGEIRRVSRIRERVQEAKKMGFKDFYLPQDNLAELRKSKQNYAGLRLVGVDNIKEAILVALSS